jgi:enamine deaminase RidA (YjgF/YER057c/UK114 family)
MARIKVIALPTLLLAVGLGATCAGTETELPQHDADARLEQLGIELYDPPERVGNYVGAVRVGNLVYIAGHGPRLPEGGYVIGKVGEDLVLEEAQQAARLTMIDMLSSLSAEIGTLNNVSRIVKVTGMINAVDSFGDHPQVMNGASDLLIDIFGDAGKHARSSVGVSSLPIGTPIEIDMVVEISNEKMR